MIDLVIKFSVFLGVLLNLMGSIMLLREFRDLIQIPFFRMMLRRLENGIEKYGEKYGYSSPSLLERSLKRQGISRHFKITEIITSKGKLQDLKRLNNDHNDLRSKLRLESYLILDITGFNERALQESLSELNTCLDEWSKEDNPEEQTDRSKALKLFIWGFGLLLLGATIDLFQHTTKLIVCYLNLS